MMRIIWLPRARKAREMAIEYIVEDNPVAALSQLDAIERHSTLLKDHPEMGRTGRVPDTRELVISRTPFILIYRIRNDEIQIIHFLHGTQQWPKDP